MTRHIRPRPARAAELQRLAGIASKCYALHRAGRTTEIVDGESLTGTEYLVIAQLLERVVLDGADVAADYWEPIPHRPRANESRDRRSPMVERSPHTTGRPTVTSPNDRCTRWR